MSLDSKILQILDSSACLSKKQVEGYLQRNLYPEELRAVELHLSECPFCSDAVDGLEREGKAQALLSDLSTVPALPEMKPRENRVEAVFDKVVKTVSIKTSSKPPVAEAAKEEKNKVVPGRISNREQASNSRPVNWLKPVGIAAALALIIVIAWYWTGNDQDRQQKDEAIAAADVRQPELQASDMANTENTGNKTSGSSAAETAVAQTAKPLAAMPKSADSTIAEPRSLAAAKADSTKTPAADKAEVPAEAVVAMKREAAPVANRAEVQDEEKEESEKASSRKKKAEEAPGSDYETGLSLYKQKQYGSALLYFKSAQRNSSDPRHYDAMYYSAMCYKATGKSRKATQLFKKLVSEGAPQASSAKKQLKEMDAAE